MSINVMGSIDLKNSLCVFQRNWAFTTADSARNRMVTGSFGPCYVVTFTSGKFSAMTHIDVCTNVDSIRVIFDRFRENHVDSKDIKITLLGGWENDPPSLLCGEKILEKIREFGGCAELDLERLFAKSPTGEGLNFLCDLLNSSKAFTKEEIGQVNKINFNSFYPGAAVNAATGELSILTDAIEAFQAEQLRQTQEFVSTHGKTIETTDFPIAEVV